MLYVVDDVALFIEVYLVFAFEVTLVFYLF